MGTNRLEIKSKDLQQYNPSQDFFVTFRRNSIYIGRSLGSLLKFKYCHIFNHPLGIVVEFVKTEDLSTVRIISDRDQKRIKISNYCLNFNLKIEDRKYSFEQVVIDGKTNTWLVNFSKSFSNSTRVKTTEVVKRATKDFDIRDFEIKFSDFLLKKYRYVILIKRFEAKQFLLIFTNEKTSKAIPILDGRISYHLPPVIDYTYSSEKSDGDLVYTVNYESTIVDYALIPMSDVLFDDSLISRELYLASRNKIYLNQNTTLINLESNARVHGQIPKHPFVAVKFTDAE